jgi:hypothetical protein
MIITAVIIVAALLALFFFVVRGFGAARRHFGIAQLTQLIEPVDLEAFRNLIDPSEDEFLRTSLLPAQYRAVQRQRLRAAMDYLAGVSHNAGILLQLGQVAQRGLDQQIADAGRKLTDDALRVRVYSMMAICKLGVRYAFPNAALQPGGIVDRYQQLTSAAMRLGRIQEPAKNVLSRAV